MNLVVGNKTFKNPKKAIDAYNANILTEEHLKSTNTQYQYPIRSYLSVVQNYSDKNTQARMVRIAAGLCNSSFFDKGTFNEYYPGFVAFSRFCDYWIRKPEDFRPKTHNPDRIFRALFEHLFCKYKTPMYFINIFKEREQYHGRDKKGKITFHNPCNGQTETELIMLSEILIGQGASVRDKRIYLPIKLTAAMSHHFLQADEHHTYKSAARRAQVIGSGGSERLAWYINDSKLGRNFDDDDFWITVIAWFARQGMFDYNQIGPMIDYISHAKFDTEFKEASQKWEPIIPNFQIKGRTVQSIMLAADLWHKDLAVAKVTHTNYKSWKGCNIPNYYADSESYEFEVVQLTTAAQLREEGSTMHHCVGSYAHSCANGSIAIFSARQKSKSDGTKKNILTIEVDLRYRRVTQARGKYNERPSPQAESVLNGFKNNINRIIPELTEA